VSCKKLVLDNVGKKFQYKWIFKGVDCQLQSGDVLSVRGNNGAGKSTLLKIISGHLTPNQGQVLYTDTNGENIDRDSIYSEISLAAPYINLLSRLNLVEILDFYQRFKPLRSGLDTEQLLKAYNDNRIIIIASNVEHDFEMCNKSLSILDYKKKDDKVKSL